jgi:hypothetical protein
VGWREVRCTRNEACHARLERASIFSPRKNRPPLCDPPVADLGGGDTGEDVETSRLRRDHTKKRDRGFDLQSCRARDDSAVGQNPSVAKRFCHPREK